MKLPIPMTTVIRDIDSDGDPTGYNDHLYNVVIESDKLGDLYATQRLGITNSPTALDWDASGTTVDATARGIFHFSNHWYFVNHNTMYRDEYGGTTHSLGAASVTNIHKVFFAETESYMVVIDPANDDGFSVNRSTLVFASIAALPATVEGGCVYLDGYIFVCSNSGNNGRIYNSTLNDPTAGYTDFVTSERSPDKIMAIERHHDHIVSFGDKSIEFFHTQAVSSGSPLLRRQDIQYQLGLSTYNGFARHEDTIVFAARDKIGTVAIYKLENFQISKVSDLMMDKWLRDVFRTALSKVIITAFTYNGRGMFCLYNGALNSASGPTFVIDGDSVYEWDLEGVSEQSKFPINGFVQQESGDTYGTPTGILANGDVFQFQHLATTWDPYVDDLGGTPDVSAVSIQWDGFDADTNQWKFCHAAELYGEFKASVSGTLTWRDQGGAYNAGRTMSLASRQRAVSLGRFSQRDWKFLKSDSDTVEMRLKGLELTISPGSY